MEDRERNACKEKLYLNTFVTGGERENPSHTNRSSTKRERERERAGEERENGGHIRRWRDDPLYQQMPPTVSMKVHSKGAHSYQD